MTDKSRMAAKFRSGRRSLQAGCSALLLLGLIACKPIPVTNPPAASPSASPSATPTTVPSPQATASSVPVASPSPTAQPSATPSPVSTPTSSPTSTPTAAPSATATPSPLPSASPLSFNRIRVIAGDDADEEDARLENGINADEMLFPTLVSDIAVDADANIWFLNGSNSILGYVTSEISSVTANQDVTYRLYWERVRDLEARGNMVLDPVSGDFYLVQTNQHRVVRIDAESGKITPVAGTGRQGFDGDGKALEVALNQPSDIARDGLGNFYITDTGNHLIRKLTPDGKLITIAGQYVLDTYVDDSDEDNEDDVPSYEPIGETTGDGGQARLARVDTPREISAEADGTVYFTSESRTIRRIDNDLIDNYVGSGIEGYNGTGFRADLIHLDETGDLAIGPDGLLYFIDNLRIRRVRFDGSFWIVEDIAGSGRERDLHDSLLDPLKADLRPTSLDFDAFGNLYVYDAAHRRLRMLEHHNGSNED